MNPDTYHWLHLPTGKTGETKFEKRYVNNPVETRAQKLELVNEWNSVQPGVWQYWL